MPKPEHVHDDHQQIVNRDTYQRETCETTAETPLAALTVAINDLCGVLANRNTPPEIYATKDDLNVMERRLLIAIKGSDQNQVQQLTSDLKVSSDTLNAAVAAAMDKRPR